jgi:hypothetical protein
MRGVLIAVLSLGVMLTTAGHVWAQAAAQQELNALTGAPAGTRCFKSVKLAQEFATRYVASGICPQLRTMDPGQFLPLRCRAPSTRISSGTPVSCNSA